MSAAFFFLIYKIKLHFINVAGVMNNNDVFVILNLNYTKDTARNIFSYIIQMNALINHPSFFITAQRRLRNTAEKC